MVYYLLSDEDGQVVVEYDNFDTSTLTRCCWPTAVRVTPGEYSADFHVFNSDGNWEEIRGIG